MLTAEGCKLTAFLRRSAEDRAELAAGEHPLGLALELADALAGDAELVAELGQRRGVAVAEAVATDQDVLVPVGQALDGLLERTELDVPDHDASDLGRPLVLDELAELRAVAVGGERLVEARGVGHGALHVEHLVHGPLQLPRDPLVRPPAGEPGGGPG